MPACWLVSVRALCSLPLPVSLLLAFLYWGAQSVLRDLPVARPDPLRMENVFFELTGSPADGVAAQAERAKRGFVWVAILGTLWASFPGFAPWPVLEAASPLSSLWAARWIGSRGNRFLDGFPFIAQTPEPSGIHWLVLSCTAHLCRWCPVNHLTPQIGSLWEPSAGTFRWREGKDSELSRNWLEKHQMRNQEILLLFLISLFFCGT